MKRLFWLLAILGLAGGTYWFVELREDGPDPRAASYRTAVAERGTVVAAVSTSGTVAPITTVIVGSQLSGQIIEILADYNSEVKTGQILARLNSDQIRARLDGARADLAQAQAARSVLDAQLEKSKADAQRAAAVADDMRAQLEKSSAQLADAEKTLARQNDLGAHGIVSAAALQTARTMRDTTKAQRDSALAQIESAKAQIASLAADQKMIGAQMQSSDAQVMQRAAVVRQIEVDLANTDIRSPVDGVVVQRNVELGQPVAASLQAPTLFLVAQDLRRIQIQANVDEADVGRVKDGQSVTFTVNAYPGRTFAGVVKQVRLGSQTVQNVVIYATVIEVDNPSLALRPGMTANLRIITEQRDNVIRVPNAALRWRPAAGQGEAPPQVTARALPGAAGDDGASGPFASAPTSGRGGPGLFVERLKGALNLSDEQKKQVDRILAENPPGGGGGGGGGQGRGQLLEKIRAVLTDEQKAKLADLAPGRGGGRNRQEGRTVVTGRVYQPGPAGEPVGLSVQLGASDGAFTEVISGLTAGATVIVGGGAAKPAVSGFRFGL